MKQIEIELDRSGPIPMYVQLAEQLERALTDGVVRPGERIENEVELSRRLKLSRPTVARAINTLVAKDLLIRRRGVGTEVATSVVRRRLSLGGLYEELKSAGLRPRTEVQAMLPGQIMPAISKSLGLPPETPLLYVERLLFAIGEPFAILRNWLPPAFADITANELARSGLLELLRERGAGPSVGERDLSTRLATPGETDLLEIRRGVPVMIVRGATIDSNGVAIEFGDHVFRGDGVEFTTQLVQERPEGS